ncbi:MAG: ATP-binding cassette domain-containing protein [Magnetospirillum sp.]|nr:ATP-binding cassette domain-containing protein [Magnetospirillum sp.]
MMPPPLLEARRLAYAYVGGTAALTGLDLTIARGERLAVLGPNGAGKTTFLLHLNGTLRPAGGQILLDGRPARYDRASLAAWRRRVGLVLQDPDDQLFAPTVAEDVSFGPLNLGLSDDETRVRVEDALKAMGMDALAGRPPHMLSFGQKKRAAIAGAVAMRPELLVLDEPTAGLDAAGAAALLTVLEGLHAAGTTLVFATHDVDFAWAWADTVALFEGGTVTVQGKAETVLADRAMLGRANMPLPLLAELGMAAGGRLPRRRAEAVDLFRAMAGRDG